jgi:hypothetical protein
MASKFRPRLFGNQPMFDPLDVALYYTHKHLAEDAESGAEASGERGAVHGSDSTHISATPAAQAVADDAARRVARASWANTKLLMKAMGCE